MTLNKWQHLWNGEEGEIDWHMTTPVKWWRVKNQLVQGGKGEGERLTDTWQHLWNGGELKINYFRGRKGEGERLADTWQHLWNGEELKIHYFKQRKGEGERLTDTWQHLWNGEELKINYFRIRKGGRLTDTKLYCRLEFSICLTKDGWTNRAIQVITISFTCLKLKD